MTRKVGETPNFLSSQRPERANNVVGTAIEKRISVTIPMASHLRGPLESVGISDIKRRRDNTFLISTRQL